MEGRWTKEITVREAGKLARTEVIPVVPCDDAAVERAVTALLQDSGLPIYGGYRAPSNVGCCLPSVPPGKRHE